MDATIRYMCGPPGVAPLTLRWNITLFNGFKDFILEEGECLACCDSSNLLVINIASPSHVFGSSVSVSLKGNTKRKKSRKDKFSSTGVSQH